LCADEPDTAGPEALRGTAIHAVAELRFNGHVVPAVIDDHPISIDMVNEADAYVDYLRSLPGAVEVERRLRFSDTIWGTADAIHLEDDVLHVIDLKTGRKVIEPDNAQMLTYAVMALGEYSMFGPFDYVKLTIFQFGIARSHAVSIHDINTHADRLRVAEQKYLDGVLEYDTSACDYCAAAYRCPAKIERIRDILTTPDHVGYEVSLPLAEEAAAWAENVKKNALRFALDGNPINGYTLVDGRATYSWKPEAIEIINQHSEVLQPPSPSQLKKIDADLYDEVKELIETKRNKVLSNGNETD
jgi:hypothetical protein